MFVTCSNCHSDILINSIFGTVATSILNHPWASSSWGTTIFRTKVTVQDCSKFRNFMKMPEPVRSRINLWRGRGPLSFCLSSTRLVLPWNLYIQNFTLHTVSCTVSWKLVVAKPLPHLSIYFYIDPCGLCDLNICFSFALSASASVSA